MRFGNKNENVLAATGQPLTLVVVADTEEEFDWHKPFDRAARSCNSITANARAQEIYDEFAITPTYCVDYCIADDDRAVEFLGGLAARGRCEIGAHLHPWVTPPYEEEVSTFNSFQGNLPESLERSKIAAVTQKITQAFGTCPTVFKAGRYGIGDNSIRLLKEAGYEIDCSFVPHTSFAGNGGPSFIGKPDQPFWLDPERTMLEVPLSKGFTGALASVFPVGWAYMFDAPWARNLKLPGILARLGLLERILLSPEGMRTDEQIRLLSAMARQNKRVFSLTYHSSSLAPGHTPYVRTGEDLDEFLCRIRAVLTMFRDELGGRFATLQQLREEALNSEGRLDEATRLPGRN